MKFKMNEKVIRSHAVLALLFCAGWVGNAAAADITNISCTRGTYDPKYSFCTVRMNADTYVTAVAAGDSYIKTPSGQLVGVLNQRTYYNGSWVANFTIYRPFGGTRYVCFNDYFNPGIKKCVALS